MQTIRTRTKFIVAAAACLVVVTAGYAGTTMNAGSDASGSAGAAPMLSELGRMIPKPGAIVLAMAACTLLLLPKRQG